MNKKTAGRISAMAMASMMMMSVCVVNASAEENEPITQLNLKKTVNTPQAEDALYRVEDIAAKTLEIHTSQIHHFRFMWRMVKQQKIGEIM